MSKAAAAQIASAMDAQTLAFETDVLAGLAQPVKSLPSRWLYDDIGSELFEKITTLPEYYPTRTETAVLTAHAEDIAEFCGRQTVIIEYGAGAIVKTEIIISALKEPCLYVPVDIAGDFLARSAEQLRSRFENLEILPVAADFTQPFSMPHEVPVDVQRVGIFLGSTIGNLDQDEAINFLTRVRRHAQSKDPAYPAKALIGIDLVKGTDVLIPAYDDTAGVTAAFNLNLLTRINRELEGTFDLSAFRHEARWNEEASSMEMHLVATRDQTVRIGDDAFSFRAGETIHTESSRKYTPKGFAQLARRAGWKVVKSWTDQKKLFAVAALVAE